MTPDECALCESQCEVAQFPDMPSVFGYRCPHCGEFAIDGPIVSMAGESLRDARLRALVRERSLHIGPVVLYLEEPAPKLSGYVPMRIDAARREFPALVNDRLDRALQNLARLSSELGAFVELTWEFPATLFAISADEAHYIVSSLERAGWVEEESTRGQTTVCLTPPGWNRGPAFVAMWFGDDSSNESRAFMQDLYENHVRSAIENAGYHCDRVDLIPHNDFIMDKVLGMIRLAPFVVADYTGNRNGVYFEAGFARGLGIPVIHTCRADHFERAHFDIKQINTITWSEPEELAEKLYHRIAGTLGLGPYSSS